MTWGKNKVTVGAPLGSVGTGGSCACPVAGWRRIITVARRNRAPPIHSAELVLGMRFSHQRPLGHVISAAAIGINAVQSIRWRGHWFETLIVSWRPAAKIAAVVIAGFVGTR
jgi:hypothetical protein